MDWDWDFIEDTLQDQIERKPDFVSGFYEMKQLLNSQSLAALFDNVDENRLQFEFNDWLLNILTHQQVPKNIKSIYFGLFSMVDSTNEHDHDITTIHFCGSPSTPAEDEDWACQTNESFLPENRYLVLTDFETIDNNINLRGNREGEHHVLIYNGLLNLLIINSGDQIRSLFLKNNDALFIGAGYDEGDAFILGKLTNHGFE